MASARRGRVPLIGRVRIARPDIFKNDSGEDDSTVPPKQSHKMVEALQKAGANVTPVFYKDSEHSFSSSKDLEDWMRRLEAFLAKNNPA